MARVKHVICRTKEQKGPFVGKRMMEVSRNANEQSKYLPITTILPPMLASSLKLYLAWQCFHTDQQWVTYFTINASYATVVSNQINVTIIGWGWAVWPSEQLKQSDKHFILAIIRWWHTAQKTRDLKVRVGMFNSSPQRGSRTLILPLWSIIKVITSLIIGVLSVHFGRQAMGSRGLARKKNLLTQREQKGCACVDWERQKSHLDNL